MKRHVLWVGILLLLWTIINGVPWCAGWPNAKEFNCMVIRYFVGFWTLIMAPALIWLLVGGSTSEDKTES